MIGFYLAVAGVGAALAFVGVCVRRKSFLWLLALATLMVLWGTFSVFILKTETIDVPSEVPEVVAGKIMEIRNEEVLIRQGDADVAVRLNAGAARELLIRGDLTGRIISISGMRDGDGRFVPDKYSLVVGKEMPETSTVKVGEVKGSWLPWLVSGLVGLAFFILGVIKAYDGYKAVAAILTVVSACLTITVIFIGSGGFYKRGGSEGTELKMDSAGEYVVRNLDFRSGEIQCVTDTGDEYTFSMEYVDTGWRELVQKGDTVVLTVETKVENGSTVKTNKIDKIHVLIE